MDAWIPIVVAALVFIDLVAKKVHWTKTAALVEKVESMLQSK